MIHTRDTWVMLIPKPIVGKLKNGVFTIQLAYIQDGREIEEKQIKICRIHTYSDCQTGTICIVILGKNIPLETLFVHKWLFILLNAFHSVLLYYWTASHTQPSDKSAYGKLCVLFLNQTYIVGT